MSPSTNPDTHELPRQAGYLLGAAGLLYVITGLPLFLAPRWASRHFAWNVSPFVAMTAGAWCLGTAAFALYGVKRPRWSAIRPCVMYPFAFGVSQMALALYERERLRTGEVLTWPYLLALALSILGGGVALTARRRQLRPQEGPGLRVTPFIRLLMVAFILLVFFLAAVAFAAPPGALNGAVFPQPLSLFSLRAFGVFYLSLGIGMLILVRDRVADGFLAYMRCGLVLVILILVATAAYGDSFDLAAHPRQFVYPLAYVVALVGASGSLLWERQQRRVMARQESESGA